MIRNFLDCRCKGAVAPLIKSFREAAEQNLPSSMVADIVFTRRQGDPTGGLGCPRFCPDIYEAKEEGHTFRIEQGLSADRYYTIECPVG